MFLTNGWGARANDANTEKNIEKAQNSFINLFTVISFLYCLIDADLKFNLI